MVVEGHHRRHDSTAGLCGGYQVPQVNQAQRRLPWHQDYPTFLLQADVRCADQEIVGIAVGDC